MNLREELYPTKIKWTSIWSNNNPSNLWVSKKPVFNNIDAIHYNEGMYLNTNDYAFRVWIDSKNRYYPFMENITYVMWKYYIKTYNKEKLKPIEFMEL